jgi:hypothetical protein
LPEWRNGRRRGLKPPGGQPLTGSSPVSGTKQILNRKNKHE